MSPSISPGAAGAWDSDRRFILRAELDAAFFHLYGISRDDAAYIMDTFHIVRGSDEKAHGEYRTKNVIEPLVPDGARSPTPATPSSASAAPSARARMASPALPSFFSPRTPRTPPSS
jgi:hypothetical protein